MLILLNASNLHVGGGVQVAASLVEELYKLRRFDIVLALSSAVKQQLSANIDLSRFQESVEVNIYGIRKSREGHGIFTRKYDVCYTVFGPFYHRVNASRHICGFAQPWICYPRNEVYNNIGFSNKIKSKIKYFIQKLCFKKYDALVVEAEHVKLALEKEGIIGNVHVVPNCLSSSFLEASDRLDFKLEIGDDTSVLGYLGRPYIHKNIAILRDVSKILFDKYRFKHIFVFAFTPQEMEDLGLSEGEAFHSIGSIKPSECLSFYKGLDALVFPSLLECFSASPIEAMFAETTVIASNRGFVSDFCGDSAFYFDPLDADDIARSIVLAFSSNNEVERKIQLGSLMAIDMPGAELRCKKTLNILRDSIHEI